LRKNTQYSGFVKESTDFYDKSLRLWQSLPSFIKKPIVFKDNSQLNIPLSCIIDTENPVGAFKIRGAYGAIKGLENKGILNSEVVAASSGSFGISVALAAHFMGRNARIFVPVTTPRPKIKKIRKMSGNVIISGDTYEEAKSMARKYASRTDAVFIDGVGWDVFLGNASLAFELLEQFKSENITESSKVAIVIPLGIGSLLVPFKLIIQETNYSVDLVAVEPHTHKKLNLYLGGNSPNFKSTIADGAAVRKLPEFSREMVLHSLTYFDSVNDEILYKYLVQFYEDSGIKLEGAAGLAYASVMNNKYFFNEYEHVFTIATGENYPENLFI